MNQETDVVGFRKIPKWEKAWKDWKESVENCRVSNAGVYKTGLKTHFCMSVAEGASLYRSRWSKKAIF